MLLAAIVAALTFAPVGAPVGTPVIAHAAHLAPRVPYALVWHTANARWDVQDATFHGIRATGVTRTIASGTSDAAGNLTLRFAVPEDFGYMHDVELQTNGTVAATQGFTVIPRLTIAPASGPLGTPVTVTMTGIGYRQYEAVWHLMYDGGQTGWLSAITTHGTARVTIRATGEAGFHTIQAIEGAAAPYLNEQQAPIYQPLIPTILGARFRIVPGPPLLPPRPVAQARLPDPSVFTSGPSLTSNAASGIVGSPIVVRGRGFPAGSAVTIEWETVVGNRLSGNGWETERRPFAHATADDRGAFTLRLRTPDDLGGDHRIVARAVGDAQPETAIPYRIVPSVVSLSPAVVAPGETITVHLKGVGWTETANTYVLDVDNALFGYACGFNSQGDVMIRLHAPGGAGVHFIDLYPTIYRNASYALLPMLNVADHPGERLPAFHLAFRVRGS